MLVVPRKTMGIWKTKINVTNISILDELSLKYSTDHMNSSTINSGHLSLFFRSLSYALDEQFLDAKSCQILLKRISILVENNVIKDSNFNTFNNSFSKGQIDSKNWIISVLNNLNIDLGVIYLCAGWYALLALNNKLIFKKFRNIDICEDALNIANEIHRDLIVDNWKYLSIRKNIHDIDFNLVQFDIVKANGETQTLTECPDTIINTSCEHINDFSKWFDSIPSNKLLIFQSNNGFEITGHVNAVENLEEFANQTPMNHVLYSSSLKLHKFTRFMRIGYK